MKSKTKSSIDIEAIRSAASGRWCAIISRVGGVPDEILDGKHHPCPKCQGEDRFRLLDQDAGALYCNQCFTTKNGDGFAAIGWLLDCSFIEAAKKVAEHVGIDVDQKKTGPAKDLEFRAWSSALAMHWLARKPGITEAALLAAGAKLADYQGHTVVAFPILGEKLNVTKPVGWVVANCVGETLPVWDKSGKKVVGQKKIKSVFCSKAGLIGQHAIERLNSDHQGSDEPIKVA